jgi:hypothetical protein
MSTHTAQRSPEAFLEEQAMEMLAWALIVMLGGVAAGVGLGRLLLGGFFALAAGFAQPRG